jgi:hypothetical protein
MKKRDALLLGSLTVGLVTVARGGHELPVYPSYYPHEIEISTVAPDRAAVLLREGKLHAYIGTEPQLNVPPDWIRPIESLGSFVVVRVNASKASQPACTTVRDVARAIAASGRLILHPYPVTPFHGDYLHHVDLAEAAKARLLGEGEREAPVAPSIKIKAIGLASNLVPAEWQAREADWDAEVLEVSAGELMRAAAVSLNGWLGPPWLKAGWFHAHSLLSDLVDESRQRRSDDARRRLTSGDHVSSVQRINLERELVGSLIEDCRTMVAGYTVKREFVNAEFSAGIENIGYDALAGLNSPMFVRTVKLKDFPWNGWLALGVDTLATAAWNPIGGFADAFGRLMWSAIGDPATLPTPYDRGWMLNRVSDVQASQRRDRTPE